jgi:hypothetical protein
MARSLTQPTRFARLHKQKRFTDACTLVGRGLEVGDVVTVTGALGTQKTQWKGTVTAKNDDGTFDCNDLHVRQLQTGAPDPAPATEDVKVQVSDPDSADASNEKTTAGVAIVDDRAARKRPKDQRRPPIVNSVAFPNGLHLQPANLDTAQINGIGISVNDTVLVVGQTSGTHWAGTVGKVVAGRADTNNLHVVRTGSGPLRSEDVSTTVTNTDGSSAPVITRSVPEIP